MEEKRDGCVECMRYGFVMINVLFLVFGIGLLFLGVWFYAVPANDNVSSITLDSVEQSNLKIAVLLVMAAGTGVSLIAIISCCGAFAQSKCLLITIFLFMISLLVLEICIGVFGLLFEQQIHIGITEQMTKTLVMDYSGDYGENPESMGWREMQIAFSCCGVNTEEGYKNHTNAVYKNSTGSLWYRTNDDTATEWPNSCCEVYKNGTSHGNIPCYDGSEKFNNFLNEAGCVDRVQKFLQNHMLTVVVTAVILIVMEVCAMICSIKLYKALPSKMPKKSSHEHSNVIYYEDVNLEEFSY